MSSAPAESPAPAFDWCPPRSRSAGADAVELAESAGLYLDPWQRLALDRILSEDDDGMPAAFEAAVIIPRQNGKGSILEALSLYWLLVERVDLVLHSAHEFKTAAEAFRRIRSLLANSADLWPEVSRVLTGAGNESIEFVDGQRLRFVARSKGSGRGFTADKVILDEAYELGDEETAALIPTLATRPAAQVLYTSSAPMSTSDVLHSVVARGRAGGDPTLAFVEWRSRGSQDAPGCELEQCLHTLDTPGCALDDPALWREANPRVRPAFIRKERRAMTPLKFMRERLGFEDDPLGMAPVGMVQWQKLADPAAKPKARPLCLALDTSKGLATTALVACGRLADGRPHVEVRWFKAGTDGVVAEAARLAVKFEARLRMLGGSATAQALAPALAEAGVPMEETTPADYAAACTLFAKDVKDARLSHLGDPLMSQSVIAARGVNVGDGGGWRWSPEKSEGDISLVVAATLARWQLEVSPQPDYDLLASVG